jgi:hypothetical protein
MRAAIADVRAKAEQPDAILHGAHPQPSQLQARVV